MPPSETRQTQYIYIQVNSCNSFLLSMASKLTDPVADAKTETEFRSHRVANFVV